MKTKHGGPRLGAGAKPNTTKGLPVRSVRVVVYLTPDEAALLEQRRGQAKAGEWLATAAGIRSGVRAPAVVGAAFPFAVDGAGKPSLVVGWGEEFTGAVLKGGLTAHHGVRVGAPCRLVEDPESPLHFAGIGELEYGESDTMRVDATERWVVLTATMPTLRANHALWGKQVRIEYADAVRIEGDKP